MFSFSDHANFIDFTLLFYSGQLRDEQSFKTHALNYYSAHYLDFFFATSSLPLSWFAEVPKFPVPRETACTLTGNASSSQQYNTELLLSFFADQNAKRIS